MTSGKNAKWESMANAAVLLLVYMFILSYFRPGLIFLGSTTAGGDTATHNYPAQYMQQYLLPEGKLIGWSPGWYAGFPMFQFYFPMLFVLMNLLSVAVSIEVAFKIVTVLGTFLLPLCTFLAMKRMGFEFPIPILSAAFTLAFLFMEANSMWGGNIPSTLAGEFTFSFSFALTVLFIGLLYRGMEIDKHKSILRNSVLLAAVALSHVYTAMFAVVMSSFLALSRKKGDIVKSVSYFFKMYGTSALLSAWLLMPMLFKMEYTTPYNHVWIIRSVLEVLPPILLPFYALAVISFAHAARQKDRKVLFISSSIPSALLLYKLSPYLGVVDIRFMPFLQFFPLLVAAYGSGICINTRTRGMPGYMKSLCVVALSVLVLVWVRANVTYIGSWIEWNYSGFENKALWGPYSQVNDYLSGDQNDPRVVYEHSSLHNDAGSTRAFENLPLFSGRSTLEGLYMQSSVSTPFVFYIQSEISTEKSCPLPDYRCTSTNVTKAAPHLAMFNVKHVIARTEKVISQLEADSENYKHVKSVTPFEIFELKRTTSYVEVPKYEPVLFETGDWKQTSYEWFKDEDAINVHLVFDSRLEDELQNASDINTLPEVEIAGMCEIQEHVYRDEIVFNTTCVGKPHIIKVSYFPNWKVEGADEIYLVSPSFMLVYPEQESVRIYYGTEAVDTVSQVLSLIGLIVVAVPFVHPNRRLRSFFNL